MGGPKTSIEAEDDDVNNYKASKQADAFMLFYLLSADDLRELFARRHVQTARGRTAVPESLGALTFPIEDALTG